MSFKYYLAYTITINLIPKLNLHFMEHLCQSEKRCPVIPASNEHMDFCLFGTPYEIFCHLTKTVST